MPKSTMTITLEKDIKENLKRVAGEMWTNASNLLSMIVVKFIKEKKIEDPFKNIEFEPFTKEEIYNINNDEEFQDEIKKMEKLLVKI